MFNGTRWVFVAAWLLAAIAASALILRAQAGLERPLNVFPSYYTAAKLISAGEDVAQFYDDDRFMRRAAEFEPLAPEIHNANTPLMGFFFLPVATLSYDAARKLTSALGLAALVAAGFLITAELKIEGAWRAIAFAGMFAAPTSLDNLQHAQVYLIVLLIMVLAWRAWRKGTESLAGGLIGIALAFKAAGLFFPPLMVLERRWHALIGAIGAIAGLTLITLPFVGLEGWSAYLQYASSVMGRPSLSFPGYWSVTSFARNLFGYGDHWAIAPYVSAPAMALLLEALLSALILVAAGRVIMVTKDKDLTFALAILLSLILVPVTTTSSSCLAFVPAFIIFSRIVRHSLMSAAGAWFLVGLFFSLAPGIDRLTVFAQWGGPLFLYWRFVGLVILTALCMVLALGMQATPDRAKTEQALRSS